MKNSFSFERFSENFNDYFYQRALKECNTSNKAKKDIVGAIFEGYRNDFIRSYAQLDLATPDEKRKILESYNRMFKPDQIVVHRKTRELLMFEEDKGHYVDKCFAKRALANAIEVLWAAKNKGEKIPYFVLSCPTYYDVESLIRQMDYLQPAALRLLREKFKFFPLCEHGRTKRDRYLKGTDNPFKLNHKLCHDQHLFYESMGRTIT